MKTALGPLLALPLAACALNSAAQDKRPNILLFMVDDMGWQDTSVPFTDSITANNRNSIREVWRHPISRQSCGRGEESSW